MPSLKTWLQESLGLSPALQDKLFTTLFIAVVLMLLRWLVRRGLRQIEDPRLRYNSLKATSYITSFIGLILIGRLWLESIQSLFTFLGLLAAGLAVALRDPIVNLFGWAFILWRRPLSVGDRVQIGTRAGDVIDIRIFQFSLLEIGNWVQADQSTGRIIHVPNGKVFTEELVNYSHGLAFIWTEIPVLITFESDWQKAKALLQDIAEAHSTPIETIRSHHKKEAPRFFIREGTLTPIVYTSVRDSGVLLTIRCLTAPRLRRSMEQAVWEAVLLAFEHHPDIELAYPTIRYYTPPHSPGTDT